MGNYFIGSSQASADGASIDLIANGNHCQSLSDQERMSMASFATRLSSMVEHLSLFPRLVEFRHVEKRDLPQGVFMGSITVVS